MPQTAICIFGECLFDCFPDGRRVLGGAPFNVAWHLSAFGVPVHFVSAVGEDAEGQAVRDAMVDWGMDIAGLQLDPDHPTGEVAVTIEGGEPSYEILPERAYDHIRAPGVRRRCDILYHGTLALRAPDSAQALARIKAAAGAQVFLDVNLRSPWWERGRTLALVDEAQWVKLNRDELALLAGDGGIGSTLADAELEAAAGEFRATHGLTGLVVTLGAQGALALGEDGPPVRVTPSVVPRVEDAVGAGDGFASVLILGLARGWPLDATLERAQAFASRIVEQPGATAADPGLYEPFVDSWGLAPR